VVVAALEVFAQSFILGLGIAMPVGPIGVLVIRRSLTQGRNVGIASGLGAATADGLYGLIATLGLSLIANFLTGIQFWTRLVGSVFLLYLAWQIYSTPPSDKAAQPKNAAGLLGAYASTLLLTFSNPATILFFFGVVSSLSIRGAGWAVVLGFFAGSALWWIALSLAASALGSRLDAKKLRVVNLVSSVVILGFAVYALIGLV
jgi:threonine/homoserine/homoserine lactone efflux protein